MALEENDKKMLKSPLIVKFNEFRQNPDYRCLVGFIGFVLAMALFLSPIWTFVQIITNKSTKGYSGWPYIATLFNCIVSAWYGLPFVTENNAQVIKINLAGAVIELIYVVMFIVFAEDDKTMFKLLGGVVAVVGLVAVVVLVSYYKIEGIKRRRFCGVAVGVASILMYASPLSVIKLVIKTKNAESMPIKISLAATLCSTCWLVYGILGPDHYVTVPNVVGCAVGLIQLVFHAIYRNGKAGTETLLQSS